MARARREADRVVIRESVAFGDKTKAEIQQNILLAIMEESGAVRISGHNVGKEQANERGHSLR